MADIIEQLRERTALKYIGDCKCGKCQLVPRDMVDDAANEIERLRFFLRGILDNEEYEAHRIATVALTSKDSKP